MKEASIDASIDAIIRRWNKRARERQALAIARDCAIVYLRSTGLSIFKVACRMDCQPTHVARVCKRKGV